MCELPKRMASLNISEDNGSMQADSQYVCSDDTETVLCSPRRVLRTKIANTSVTNFKRRCKLPPKKFSMDSQDNGTVSFDELVTHYTSKGAYGTKTIKCLLETIYEEPKKLRNGSFLSIGIKRVKRTISFSNLGCVNKTKQRKRKAKAKLLSKWSPNKTGKNRVSLDNLLAKLELEEGEVQNASHSGSTVF